MYNGDMAEQKNEFEKQSPKAVKKSSNRIQNLLVALMFAFAVLAVLAKNIPYFPFDLLITRSIQQITLPGFKQMMILLTSLGNPEFAIFSVILFAIALLALGKSIYAVFYILSVSGTEIISFLFKTIIARPRPSSDLISQLYQFHSNDSFPSGHVLYYIGCYGFLAYLIYTHFKKGSLKKVLIGILGFFIVGIGISRIYVGAHWFSDTLGAYLIGTVWLFIVTKLFVRYAKKDT